MEVSSLLKTLRTSLLLFCRHRVSGTSSVPADEPELFPVTLPEGLFLFRSSWVLLLMQGFKGKQCLTERTCPIVSANEMSL